MTRTIRIFLSLLSILTVFPALATEAWPNKTIRFVVPTAAGSSVDLVARVVADKLGPMLGQTVIETTSPALVA